MLADTARRESPRMITFECAWCGSDVTIESLDSTEAECSECVVTIEFAPDDQLQLASAA